MDLHKEFVKLSFDIIRMKNRLTSLLLEIYEREIYKNHNCRTIYEYAFKYAKLSKEVVDKAVRTLRHLEGKPALKKIIETQGIHKVAMVATLATAENEAVFAKHVCNMSKPALFEFTKELRYKEAKVKLMAVERTVGGADQDEAKLCKAVPDKIKIELDEEMQILFFRFKQKYAKNLSNQEALKIMMRKVENVLVMDGEVGSKEVKLRVEKVGCDDTESGNQMSEINDQKKSVPGNGKSQEPKMDCESSVKIENIPSRYISKGRRNRVLKKYQNKCAYPGCVKAAETMHHRVPFSFEKSHESIVPLCKTHHEFAHNGVIGHELKEPKDWTLKMVGTTSIFDEFYQQKRNEVRKD